MAAVHAIYAIRNVVNNNMYIGSAYNPARRWAIHRAALRRGTHHCQPLQRAFVKYGESSFDYSIVEYVDDKIKLLSREQVWLNFFRPRYNVAKVAGNPTAGRKWSAEMHAKMLAALKGRTRPPFSPEWKANISAGKKGQIVPWSEERRKRFNDPAYRKQWAETHAHKLNSRASVEKRAATMRGNTNAMGFKYPSEAYESRRGPRKPKESAPRP